MPTTSRAKTESQYRLSIFFAGEDSNCYQCGIGLLTAEGRDLGKVGSAVIDKNDNFGLFLTTLRRLGVVVEWPRYLKPVQSGKVLPQMTEKKSSPPKKTIKIKKRS